MFPNSRSAGWDKWPSFTALPISIDFIEVDDVAYFVATSSKPFGIHIFNFADNIWSPIEGLESRIQAEPIKKNTLLFFQAAAVDPEKKILYALFNSSSQAFVSENTLILYIMNFDDIIAEKRIITPIQIRLQKVCPCSFFKQIFVENDRLHGINHQWHVMWNLNDDESKIKPIASKYNISYFNGGGNLVYSNNREKLLLYSNSGVYELTIHPENIKNDPVVYNPSITRKTNYCNWNNVMKFEKQHTKWDYPIVLTDFSLILAFEVDIRSFYRICVHNMIDQSVYFSKIKCPSGPTFIQKALYIHDFQEDYTVVNAFVFQAYSQKILKRLLPKYLIACISRWFSLEFVHLFYHNFYERTSNSHWRINIDFILQKATK